MMSKVRWQNLWSALTVPAAVDADEARREYMTKVISLSVTVVALGVMVIFVLGWLLGLLPLDSVFISLGMALAFGGAWRLADRGHWRAAGYIPPVVVFLTAVYGNWIGGAGAPAMVLYALAIVLTAILQSERAQWIMLLFSIAAYLGIGQVLLSGYIVQSRFPETAFANRVVIVTGVYISLASLLWFLIDQFRRALAQARVYAERLAAANQQLEHEITIRQQADESLRQSNEVLQALIDCSPLAIVQLDRDGQVLLWNRAAEERYGWTRAEVLGKFAPMIPDKYLPEYQAMRARLLQGETLTNLEVERQRKDGSLIQVNLSMAPLRDAHGTITAFMSIIVDITESQKAKAALRESEERFRLFMQHFPGLAYIKDAATRVLFANQGFMDYLNIAPAAILGKTNRDIFPAEFADQITADDQHVLESGVSEVIEERYAGRVWSTYKFVISQTDRPTLLGGFTLDITERKRAEEALREKTAELDRYFTNALDLLCIADTDGYFQRLNKEWEATLGYSVQELEGTRFLDYVHPDDKEATLAALSRLEKQKEVLNFVNRYRSKDGSYRWIEWRSSPVGKMIYAAARDITERKRAEAQIEHALRETRVRFEVSQALAGKETEDAVLDALIEHTGLYPQALVAIFTFDRKGDELVAILRRQDPHESGLTVALSIGEGLPASRYTLFNRFSANQPFVAEDVRVDERFEPDGREILRQTGAVSYAAIPLVSGNEWLGYLAAMARPSAYFDEEKQHLYRTLAEQGAVALRAARLRETIRESQQRLSLLVQESPLAVIEWNTDWQVVSWNPAAERIFGYSREEAQSRYAADFIMSEEAWPVFDRDRQAMLAHQHSVHGTYDHLTRDGQHITCEWFSVPLVSSHGRVIGVASLVQDITERKRAEQALRESEERLRQIASSLREAIWLRDAQTRQVLYVNPAFEKLTGRTCENFYENPDIVIDATHPDDKELVIKALDQRFESVLFDKEHRIIHLDGKVRWVSSRIFPVRNEAGEVYRWASIMEDITERKQAEAERENLIKELEAKNAELERFTYTVSHDLKAPLITIRGFMGLLERDTLAGNFEQARSDMERISNAANKMQRLLNELLELSRIGRVKNPSEAVPFEVIVQEAVELVRGRIEIRGVHVEIESDLPTVYGDRARLGEVVQNLMDNACKFMGNQPEPRITIGQRGADRAGNPILFVRDNGMGIEPAYQDKVFGLFNKLDAQTEGTGIGLALVKRIVEVHGGRIWVESEGAGAGSTFYFTLPINSTT